MPNRGLFAYRQVKPLDTVVARAIVEGSSGCGASFSPFPSLRWLGLHALPKQPLQFILVALVAAFIGPSGLLLAVTTAGYAPRARLIDLPTTRSTSPRGVIWNMDKFPAGMVRLC